ncbi:MAG: hypothetical protein JO099_25655, partial [Acidobacteriia bacterium]|nr:hypothetical protein [Terriglobia bacterium]
MFLALLSILGGAGLVLFIAYGLGVGLLRNTPAPPEIALALGAAAESFLVFLLLLANLGYWWAFGVLGLAAALCWKRYCLAPLADPIKQPLGKPWVVALIIFGAYGIW